MNGSHADMRALQSWVYQQRVSLQTTDPDYFAKYGVLKAVGAQIRAMLAAVPAKQEPGPLVEDQRQLLSQVASIICEETCGLTSLCKSREAAKALFDKGYLSALSAQVKTPPAVAVKLDSIAHRVHALARMVGTSFFEDVEKDLRDLSAALSAQVQDVAVPEEPTEEMHNAIRDGEEFLNDPAQWPAPKGNKRNEKDTGLQDR